MTFQRYDLVGFDKIEKLLNDIERTTKVETYPPYNTRKIDSENYLVEIAVAGFQKDEIDIKVEDGKLIVTGTKKETDEKVEYIHKGIATRNFKRIFTLLEYFEVTSAEMQNGLLLIKLFNNIPESKKPKSITIK